MRQIFFAVMFALLTVANACAADDVWIERWQSEGVDIYAADNSISGKPVGIGN